MNDSDLLIDETLNQTRWDKIAWNGIAFYKPATWEIATIGRNYMMIGTHAHPRMEITWGDTQKTVLQTRDIRKLQSRIRKRHLAAVDLWAPSTDWLQALSSYETSGFSWKRPDRTSYGLIVSCLICRRVSLIQFFQNSDEPDNLHAVAPRVLSSFIDHVDGNNQQWAVFDIRATLPADFKIKTYQFSPGFMEMVFFSQQGRQISLYRWSPASILLSGKSLTDFAESLRLYPNGSFNNIPNPNMVEWESSRSLGFWTRFATLLSGGFFHYRILIRHDPETNRILATKAESRQDMDPCLFDRIFSSYEISTA